MCGRFTLSRPGEVLDEAIQGIKDLLDERLLGRREDSRKLTDPLPPRFNIAPTQPVPVLRATPSGVNLWTMNWGFPGHLPGHRKVGTASAANVKPVSGRPLINARAESLTERPSFRDSYRHRRCLVLADGFYEWRSESRQPFYFRPRNRLGLCFAGLWTPLASERSERPDSCCIVTTRANEVVHPIHDRMPVILDPDDYRLWLDPGVTDAGPLEPLLRPAAATVLERHPVSRAVNRTAVDGPSLIVPVEEAPPEPRNLSLF